MYGESKILGFIINDLDGWPILDSKYFNRNPNSTLKTLTKLFKNGISPLFNLYVSSSPSDPNKAVLRVKFKDFDSFWLKTKFNLFVLRLVKLLGFILKNITMTKE